MSNAKFEIVTTDAGHHSRFRATNGEIVWTTETYTRKEAAYEAIMLISGKDGAFAINDGIKHVDERVLP